jgi:hypothetical protein
MQDSTEYLGTRLGCPKESWCSVPWCPLLGGKHLQDEPVCSYMLEAVKDGGPSRITMVLRKDVAQVVVQHALRLLSTPGTQRRTLERASQSASKMEAGQRLAHRQHHDCGAV